MADDARDALWQALGWLEPPAAADEALTHRSFTNEQSARRQTGQLPDNQRLEFLGDSVLGLCASELLIEEFPDADEGELSRMRAALVKAEPLAAFARKSGVGEALRLGKGADLAGDRKQTNVLADAVEALVAAAYLDGGLDRARALVRRIVADGLEKKDELGGRDPKSALQELVQGDGKRAPVYRLADSEGPDHDRWFRVEVLVEDEVVGEGRGRSKKIAEQEAAQAALEKRET